MLKARSVNLMIRDFLLPECVAFDKVTNRFVFSTKWQKIY